MDKYFHYGIFYRNGFCIETIVLERGRLHVCIAVSRATYRICITPLK